MGFYTKIDYLGGTLVIIMLKHELNRVKNGYTARSPELRLAAYGATPEMALRNLEHMANCFLRPFERQGALDQEIAAARLEIEPDGAADLIVKAVAPRILK